MDCYESSAPGLPRGIPVGENPRRMWRPHYSASASDLEVDRKSSCSVASRVFTHGHWMCRAEYRDAAKHVVPSCFRRTACHVIQGAAGGNEKVWCGLHCGSAIHTPACFLRLWGRRIRADDRCRFVARHVSRDTLRVRRLSSFVSRMVSTKAQSRRLGPCVASGQARRLCFPL